MLFASDSATEARGERFLRESFGVPAGVLAMFMVNAASEPELSNAIDRTADAVSAFMIAVLLKVLYKQAAGGLKLSLRQYYIFPGWVDVLEISPENRLERIRKLKMQQKKDERTTHVLVQSSSALELGVAASHLAPAVWR